MALSAERSAYSTNMALPRRARWLLPRMRPLSSAARQRKKQGGREVGGVARFPGAATKLRPLAGIGRHRLTIEVPGRMPQNGHHHRQTEQERQRSAGKPSRHDQTPQRHGEWTLEDRAERRNDGGRHADIAVEEQREGYGAQCKRGERKQEADGIAPPDQIVA